MLLFTVVETGVMAQNSEIKKNENGHRSTITTSNSLQHEQIKQKQKQ